MSSLSRRQFLKTAGAAALSPVLASASTAGGFRLATFRFDVTPPLGHALCGGWIKPVEDYDDPLEAIGYVLLGAGAPIVVCVVDWLGILNEAHLAWRQTLAAAAGTTPDRVTVHCVHQHNAPLVCFAAARHIAQFPDLAAPFDQAFHDACLERAGAAVRAALPRARQCAHVAFGRGRVEKVASNRRVQRDAQGRVGAMRGSACRVPELIALPEGLIDPELRTIAFYDGATKIVACHYYATHPMSYYGDGRVSSDFCGLARKRRQREEPSCTHLYFTGCGGNIAAGKYNDGSKELRAVLTERMHAGMLAAEQALRPEPLKTVRWRTHDLLPDPNPAIATEALTQVLSGQPPRALSRRVVTAFKLGWLHRLEQRTPIILSALELNDISALHLPGECFVEYQLNTQARYPRRRVAVAAFGDGGPLYVPTQAEYPHGGYEVSMALCADSVDDRLTQGLRHLLT